MRRSILDHVVNKELWVPLYWVCMAGLVVGDLQGGFCEKTPQAVSMSGQASSKTDLSLAEAESISDVDGSSKKG